MAHASVAQVAVALNRLQKRLQPPQWFNVRVLCSQPLLLLRSQLSWSESHTGAHTPAVHEVLPLALLHVMLHPPQWLTSSSGFRQMPVQHVLLAHSVLVPQVWPSAFLHTPPAAHA